MKERELSSIIIQLNDLLLSCNTLMCNSGVMENAEKKYGFHLLEIPSNKYKSGFYYAVRYKDPDNGEWLPTKKSTDTDNEALAKSFAIENKDAIIQEYKDRKEKREKKNGGEEFYKMLREYYQLDSKYLQDDAINNKRAISKKQRTNSASLIDTHLIPYLQSKKINSIQDINRNVYSGFKIYLQGQENLSTKTINNYLTALNRILQYHERNELIPKLPYVKGTGLIKISNEEKADSKKASILPTEYLHNIFANIFYVDKKDAFFSYLLAVIGLATGMRDSEIGRMKREDIKYIKSINAYYLIVANNKTAYFNKNGTDEYRKIPLHPFIVEKLKMYIQTNNKEKTDYLFGVSKTDSETGKTDGYLHYRKPRKAIIEFYKRIKIKEKIQETGNLKDLFSDDILEPEKEMKEKNIIFYSLRHTFETLFGMKYKGQTLLIDYFMGHRPIQAMLANYLHINKVDEITFWNEYGKHLIDFQDYFIPKEDKALDEAIHNFSTKVYAENKHLLNDDGSMNINDALDTMIPLFKKKADTDNQNDDDDFFDCV